MPVKIEIGCSQQVTKERTTAEDEYGSKNAIIAEDNCIDTQGFFAPPHVTVQTYLVNFTKYKSIKLRVFVPYLNLTVQLGPTFHFAL